MVIDVASQCCPPEVRRCSRRGLGDQGKAQRTRSRNTAIVVQHRRECLRFSKGSTRPSRSSNPHDELGVFEFKPRLFMKHRCAPRGGAPIWLAPQACGAPVHLQCSSRSWVPPGGHPRLPVVQTQEMERSKRSSTAQRSTTPTSLLVGERDWQLPKRWADHKDRWPWSATSEAHRRLPVVQTQEMERSQQTIHRREEHDPDELARR